MRPRDVRWLPIMAVVATLLLAAWPAAGPALGGQATPVAPATPGPPAPAAPAELQLRWVIDLLNGDPAAISAETLRPRFSAETLDLVPVDQLVLSLRQVAAAGPWTLGDITTSPNGSQAAALIDGRLSELLVTISVEPVAPHRIISLLFQPPPTPSTPVPLASWPEFDAAITALAPQVSFLAAEVVGGECEPIDVIAPDQQLAIGSAFKLYVLGELARQIEAGEASWDEELAISDAWKSLPSGEMRHEPAGTLHALRYYAEQMISVSDNTAADHLLAHLGRERVEAAQAALGHDDPAANVPFLATREMFAIKLHLSPQQLAAYLKADVTAKRRLLAERIDPLPLALADMAGWTTPREIATIEWFASAADLCRAMVALDDLAKQPGLAPVGEILAINPGLAFDQATWEYVGYKGGSEPGVLNLTWLLRRADGRSFVFSLGMNDPAAPLDEPAVFSLVQGAVALLGETP